MKDNLIRALKCEPVERTPVWIMRQAGRYLPEYRAVRATAGSFLKLCKTPELACKVTMQPMTRYPLLDAAIIFSDILTIPDALGLELELQENIGPVFNKPINSEQDVDKLRILQPDDDLKYVMDAIKLTKNELNGKVPLIGFAGTPWTIAAYMVEGRASKQFNKLRCMLYAAPKILEKLLYNLQQNIILYLQAQIAAGADVIMLFDSWAGLLGPAQYNNFSLKFIKNIISALNSSVPVILFSKNGGNNIVDIINTGCNAIGVDWTADLGLIKNKVGNNIALQGNLDPAVLYGDEQTIRREVQKVLTSFDRGFGSGHIFNLGHGIYPDIDPAKLQIVLEAVHGA